MKTHPVIGADAITKAMEQSLAGAGEGVAETQAVGAFPSSRSPRDLPWGTTRNGTAAALPGRARRRRHPGFRA